MVKIDSTMRGEDRVWTCPLCGQEWSDGLGYRIGTVRTAYWNVVAHQSFCRVELMINEAAQRKVKDYCPFVGKPVIFVLDDF